MIEIAILGFFAGAAAMLAGDWIAEMVRWRGVERSRRAAKALLANRGLSPQLYLATIGETDPTLRSALDTFASAGYIIIDGRGEVVGKLCPEGEPQLPKRLRLVVSND